MPTEAKTIIINASAKIGLRSTSGKVALVGAGGDCCECANDPDEPIVPTGSDCDMRTITITAGDEGDVTIDICEPGTLDLSSSADKASMSHGDTVTLTCIYTNNTSCDPIDWDSEFGSGDGFISDTAYMVLTSQSSNWDSSGTLAGGATITFWATWTYDATGLVAADLTASPACCNSTTGFGVTWAGQDRYGPGIQFCGVDATP